MNTAKSARLTSTHLYFFNAKIKKMHLCLRELHLVCAYEEKKENDEIKAECRENVRMIKTGCMVSTHKNALKRTQQLEMSSCRMNPFSSRGVYTATSDGRNIQQTYKYAKLNTSFLNRSSDFLLKVVLYAIVQYMTRAIREHIEII